MINANGIFGRRRYGALLVLAWAWVALFHTDACSASPDKLRLQLKWYHQFQFAGYYAAQSKGFYKDEGLDVEIIEGAPDKPPEKMVLENKAEFGVDDGADLIFRRLQGDSLVALAAIFQHSSHVIISKLSTGIRHPSDLVGRKVLIGQDQGSAQILAMFRREGIKVNSTLDEKPVRFAPHSWNVEDLIEGRADAMTAYLTEMPRFKRQYGFVPAILNPLDYGIDFYGDTLFTSEEFLKAEPQVVERFRRASLKGWQFAMANPEAIADLILSLSSTRQNKPDRQALLDEAQVMDTMVLPKLVEIGNMNPGRWEQMAKTYQEQGMVDSISSLEGFTYEVDAAQQKIRQQLRLLSLVLAGITLLAIISLVWIWQLRRQVRSRTQELASSEETYRVLVAKASDPIFSFSAPGKYAYANQAFADGVGKNLEDIAGRNVWDIFPKDEAEKRYQISKEIFESGKSKTIEVRVPRPDGDHFYLTSLNPIFDDRNQVISIICNSKEITERKKAEEASIELGRKINQLNQRFSLAADSAKIGVWDYLVPKDELIWDKWMHALYGVREEEFLGTYQAWQHGLHPKDRGRHNEEISAALRDEKDFDTEFRVVWPSGETRYIKASAIVLRDVEGKPLRMIGVNYDITERKQAQEKLQLAASVFEHAREGITITDPHGTIVDINETFTRITGYSREDAIGQNPRFLSSGRQGEAFYESMWHALIGQGHWSGEIWNRRKNGEVYAELLTISAVKDEHGVTQQYVALFSDITGIKEHQRQLEYIAHFDTLTNLPNRLLLADRLQQAMAQAQRRGQQVAVVYLDFDGFKAVNDKYGHDVGDQLLMHLATAMKDTLREGDTLARLGGDEFVAVLTDLDGIESCIPMLARLLAAAAAPVQFGAVELKGSASIGVTFFPQNRDIEADQLLRQADQAMYQAKLAGKNRYHVFDAAHDSSLRVHHESLERIRVALVRGELVLHYQPKVNMRSGQVIGTEALIRWQHPEKGLLAPAAFLPVIEDHALSVEVGEWVIDTALTQMEVWHAAGLRLPVSVNIGAHQLQQGDFVARLQAILAKHPQVNPANLELEVLETSALADMAQVSQVIEDCAQIGVKFALDDFGTGYSSLTYLKLLRVTLLKIDQSFVRDMLDDPDDLAILEGIIGLAAAFKREVIAEGVETVAHGAALLQLGCEMAQGYGIARPMPPEQMPDWAATWQPDAAWSELP